jgi:glycosyltransferase involved in cell wall biosynthesis
MTSRVMVVVPAFNEAGAIAAVVRDAIEALPEAPVFVIDDCSSDATADIAQNAGAHIIRLPVHLGLGGCVQTGYKLAFERGYDYVLRIDGDGQHDPRDLPRILDALETTGVEVVIGSRFAGAAGAEYTSVSRYLGIVFFRALLRPILGKPIHDPTSGFVGVNRRALEVFARTFPLEYPEIEALVVLQRRRFRFHEIPCVMRPRTTGRSSITALKSFRYILHVLLGVFVNVLKYDGRPAPK